MADARQGARQGIDPHPISVDLAAVQSMADADAALADEIATYYDDPLGFCLFAWDWNTGPLDGWHGPNRFQERYLHALGKHIRARGFDGFNPVAPILMSRASGHGIGKSALCGMLVTFIMATRPHCRGVVTANTAAQLRTKTFAEIAKWHSMSIVRHWFDVTTGIGNMAMWHKQHRESWRVDGQT